MKFWGPLTLLIPFFLVGFFVLGIGLRDLRNAFRAARWPSVWGRIIELDVEEDSSGEGSPTYKVKVRYDYRVGRDQFENSRIAFGYGSGERAQAERLRDKLRGGLRVAVRYDPDDPRRSCLSYGMNRGIIRTLSFAAVWLTMIGGFLFFIWLSTWPDAVLMRNLIVE